MSLDLMVVIIRVIVNVNRNPVVKPSDPTQIESPHEFSNACMYERVSRQAVQTFHSLSVIVVGLRLVDFVVNFKVILVCKFLMRT